MQQTLDFREPDAEAKGAQVHALGEGCFVDLYVGSAPPAELERDFLQLSRELPWVQEIYRRPGVTRAIAAPRLTAFHGDPGSDYAYAGLRYRPHPWHPRLRQLRDRVAALTAQDYNCVLANLYRDGQDSVGYHADDEQELGPSRDNIVVASLSLGAPRRFMLKHRRSGTRHTFELGEGKLLVMRGRTQQLYVHSLPKTQRAVGLRLNLTFRIVI